MFKSGIGKWKMYEMRSVSSEQEENSALFRNLWSRVYNWGFLTQIQNSILVLQRNKKHKKHVIKQKYLLSRELKHRRISGI